MSTERSPQELFSEALEIQSPAERARFLDDTCGRDTELRERVERLLRAHEEAGGFFSRPSESRSTTPETISTFLPVTEKPGDRIERYKLLQQIGEGGCGVVYMAEQEEPVRRRVALKVIKLGMDTKQVVARFQAERQALALMDHQNIARVLDAGATETGRPYFVMELVRGVKITDFCDEQKLSTEARLKLFIQVCQAIQHAHQKGVIHRDIKPSNILVTLNEGEPVPKVIDFGIAKATAGRLTDLTLFTAFEQFIGTPAYMSPEQALMTSEDIDTRSDIYSLGVLLYELLTGSPPFDRNKLLSVGLDEMRRTIREVEPPRPSNRLSTMTSEALTTTAQLRHTEAPKLVHQVRGDLDWIAMKCLEKNRARRYETANALAADVHRHLENEPVTARPPSRWYEFQKTVRRHKVGFAATAAVILSLSLGVLASTHQAAKAKRAEKEQSLLREEAQQEREQAQREREEAQREREQAEANERRAETEAARSAQVARFLQDILKSAGPSVASGRDVTLMREMLDRTTERLSRELEGQPEVEAELRVTIGFVYFEIAEYEKALFMYRSALQLMRSVKSEDDRAVADLLFRLGEAYRRDGRPNTAARMAKEALAIYEKLTGHDDPSVGALLNLLGWVIKDSEGGTLVDAEAMLRDALAINERFLGKDHPQVGLSLSRLGHTLRDRGKLVEAESVLNEAVRVQRKALASQDQILGLASPYVELGWTLRSLGLVQRSQGKLAEAETSCREAVALMKTVLREHHIDIMEASMLLADILFDQGKFDEAISIYQEEVAKQKQAGNKPTRSLDESLSRLSVALENLRKFEEAEAVRREEIETERKLSGNDHPFVANGLDPLARVLTKLGRLNDAEAAAQEAFDIRRSKQGLKENATRTTEVWLGLIQRTLGKESEAVDFVRNEVDLARSADGTSWGTASSRFAWHLCLYADALLLHNSFEDARWPAEQAWALYKQHSDWSENERYSAYQVYSSVVWGIGDYSAVEMLHRERLALERSRLPEEHFEIAAQLEQLAVPLMAQQKFTEADETRRQALAMRHSLALKTTGSSDTAEINDAAWFLATCEDEAFRDGMRALQLAEQAVRVTDRKDPNMLDTLAAAHAELGRFDEALNVLNEAIALATNPDQINALASRLEFYEARKPYRDFAFEINTAGWFANQVQRLLYNGKAIEAETVARVCLEIRELRVPDDWRTFNARSQLAGSLLGQQKYEEVESLLLSGYEGMKQREDSIPPLGKPRIRETLQRLVQFYEATGQPQKAAEWNAKLVEFDGSTIESQPQA